MNHGEQDPLDRVESGVKELVYRQAWEQTNRLSLLWVHSSVGIFAGMFMMINGTATAFELWLGQAEARTLIGSIGAFGGTVLAVGLAQKPRNMGVESFGLVVLAMWDLALMIGFLINFIDSPTGTSPPRLYPVIIYGGYFMLLSVHVLTLYLYKSRKGKR